MMKTAFILLALLATVTVAIAANVGVSADITLDTRTQGVGVLAVGASVDSRGLTRALSLELALDTRIPLGTMIMIR